MAIKIRVLFLVFSTKTSQYQKFFNVFARLRLFAGAGLFVCGENAFHVRFALYELLFKGSKTGSYLTVEKKPGRSVPVGVWEVTQADEKALDRYEGFPNFYYKKELTLPIKGIRTGIFVPKKSTHNSITELQKSNRLQARDSCTIIKI